MARALVLTLVNPTDKDVTDFYGGDDYVVPAHGELAVPDYIAFHFCGDGTEADLQRAKDRMGEGHKNAVGLKLFIKEHQKVSEPKKEEKTLEVKEPEVSKEVTKKDK